MVKHFYTQHSNHFSNLTTTEEKRIERSVAFPTTWYYDYVANFRLF